MRKQSYVDKKIPQSATPIPGSEKFNQLNNNNSAMATNQGGRKNPIQSNAELPGLDSKAPEQSAMAYY